MKSYWEKHEHIEKQKVMKVGRGKYIHVEVVDYKKKKKHRRRHEYRHSCKCPWKIRTQLGGGLHGSVKVGGGI